MLLDQEVQSLPCVWGRASDTTLPILVCPRSNDQEWILDLPEELAPEGTGVPYHTAPACTVLLPKWVGNFSHSKTACEFAVSINGSGILDVIWLSQVMFKPPPGYEAVTVSVWQW